jgi:branched-subunit amino acid aminotransferase/4-amino-4-deoxychorismate lyase
MGNDVNEVILADGDGRLYEGLSSNFFVVQDGSLVTAPSEHVLVGTVSKMVCSTDRVEKESARGDLPRLTCTVGE